MGPTSWPRLHALHPLVLSLHSLPLLHSGSGAIFLLLPVSAIFFSLFLFPVAPSIHSPSATLHSSRSSPLESTCICCPGFCSCCPGTPPDLLVHWPAGLILGDLYIFAHFKSCCLSIWLTISLNLCATILLFGTLRGLGIPSTTWSH